MMGPTYLDIETPVGRLRLVSQTDVLIAVLWENDRPRRVPLNKLTKSTHKENTGDVLSLAKQQFDQYFAGERTVFTVPIELHGTAFQKQVWQSLLTIPFGQTRSYGQLAKQIDNPKAVRAVGAANGRNPISIIVPCHRVIGASGKLTGFAGGLDTKKALLAIEATGREC